MSEYNDDYWMAQALARAERAEALGEVPVGAVVVRDGELIGEGWNQPISGCDPTAHAEILALRDAARRIGNYRLIDATLYVTIEPCTMCAGALVHSRIRRLVYGATEPKAGVMESNGELLASPWFNYRIETLGGVLGEACSAKISAFFARRREEKRAAKAALKAPE
ncbi:tRNA adenosine(34) deaminase TadA [Motiliproteus sediminis]|uniref:tRNA adenosine(34) deaminase TadA n=1 Tax=Motiliproteus sediminis TaxID=1468178 RepID=UPI001AEF9D67|nr:tRNA adenosine(34) deaminase TadA [Motiliproteus sediminis]